MMAGDTKAADRLTMGLGRISDVGLPTVAGVAGCEPAHDPVARHLGDDRSGGDREAERIAFDDGLHLAIDRRSDAAVNECDIGVDPEHGHGARHRQQRRAQDVDAVYFVHARRADPDASGAASGATSQRPIAVLALFDGEYLRIVEPIAQRLGEAAGIENYRGRDDRSGERPAPGLIDAAHQSFASPFERKIRHYPVPIWLLP